MTSIVPFSEEHREEVTSLWDINFNNADRDSYYRDIDASLRSNPGLFWMAVKDGSLVGTCVGAYDGHRSWIYYLCVATSMRRQGIGTKLLRHVEGLMLANGATQVGLHVFKGSHEAIGFYRSRGYFVEEACCMGKRLP